MIELKKLYKSVVKCFFFIKYGKIKKILNFSNQLEIIKFKVEKKNYKIYKIINCRIFTDSVHDLAFIINNKILKEPSFQLRNLINSNIKNNIVLSSGTPRFLKKIKGPILCLLTGGAGNNNYWHWMYDVLPRIALIEKKYNLKFFRKILIPNDIYSFQKETLKLLKLEKKILSSKKFKHIKTNCVISTNHPWQHSLSAHKDIGNVPKWISIWLKKKFLIHKSNKKFYEKIYIDRSDSKFHKIKQRQIINEKEIINFLTKKNFKIIKLTSFSFIEQMSIFNSAKIIVGNHGAGFTNLIFCKKKTKIIEFIDKNTSKVIKKISNDMNLNYKSIIGKRINKDLKNQNNNLKISIKKLSKLL